MNDIILLLAAFVLEVTFLFNLYAYGRCKNADYYYIKEYPAPNRPNDKT